VVSGAAGSVGSVVCQIGKIHGAKVIGIAGTDEKCRWLREEIKIDAVLNYKSPTFHDEFKNAVGNLDVFFDNVGGEILDFALTRLNKGARIALCGESKPEDKKSVVSILRVTNNVRQVPSPVTVRSLLSRRRPILTVPR
jgi:NADPH-dependent curcumin reductase CurA